MLTRELEQTIDERWNACWPISTLRPIVILDLVSYLFFIKETVVEVPGGKDADVNPGSFLRGATDNEALKNDFFSDAEKERIFSILTGENGTSGFEKEYAQNEVLGSYFKSGLLMLPTRKLFENAFAILKLIENADIELKGKVFEYLLSKAELNDPNGHAYLPDYLAKLMVSLAHPDASDFVLDPSSGNGSLLVECAGYIENKNKKPSPKSTTDFDPTRLKGMESDITSLRIAAMNLMLHGVSKPELKVLDIFSPLNSITDEDATVVVANLIFLPGENNRNVEANTAGTTVRKEIYYLDFILKNLKREARCTVIVPDIILYQIGQEFATIRQELIENYKLDAVITIEDKQANLLNGAAILVFSKEVLGSTEKVWFYKLNHSDESFSPAVNSFHSDAAPSQAGDIEGILESDRIAGNFKADGKGFYVSADDIRAKNYNFSYNEYRPAAIPKPSGAHTITIQSHELPKWKPKNINETASLLQPVSNTRPEVIESKSEIKKPDWQKWIEKKQNRFPSKKIISKKPIKKPIFIALLLITGCLFWYIFLRSDTDSKNKSSAPAALVPNVEKRNSRINASSLHSIDSLENAINSDLSKDNQSQSKARFIVISKAFFYSSPSLDNPENIYITNMKNDTLTAFKEENGFVYVDDIDSKGKSRKGWLNTNDLEAISSSALQMGQSKKNQKESLTIKNYQANKYVIKTKTYFYLKPDINTKTSLYLAKPNHTLLVPLKDENGFVFVVYTNTKGKSTRGWLSKLDLEPVEK